MKLSLVVAALQAGPNNGFRFGVTTCPSSRQKQFQCHVQDFCKSGAECGGNSIWMKVFNINKVGEFVTFEKMTGASDLLSITVNHRSQTTSRDEGSSWHLCFQPTLSILHDDWDSVKD